MGIVEASENGFGLEAAGIVRRTGPKVDSLSSGDRVMLIGNSTFGTQVTVSENLCERIPGGLSFEDAATMPCVFATSIYSIFNVGKLKKGQVCSPSTFYPPIRLLTLSVVHPNSQCLRWSWPRYNPACPDGWCRDLYNSR
jgi:hypothetical protein